MAHGNTTHETQQTARCARNTLIFTYRWDCFEEDRRGRNALFWAAGGGHIKACEALTEPPGGLRADTNASDLSTPLHWAATGVEAKRFGTGGHVDVSTIGRSAPNCSWLGQVFHIPDNFNEKS